VTAHNGTVNIAIPITILYSPILFKTLFTYSGLSGTLIRSEETHRFKYNKGAGSGMTS
jgi:hypothetical protein